MSVSALGYLGLSVSDPAAWRSFACDVLGLMPGSSEDRLRIDSRDWRIRLHQGSEDDLAYVGFEVASHAELRELETRIAAAGVTVKRADAELLKARGVSELVSTEDPAGLVIELCERLRVR